MSETNQGDDLTSEQRAEFATGRLYAAAVLKKAQAEAYEQGRADERAVIVAWLKLNAAKAAEQAEIWLSAGKTPDFVGLLVHSEECFQTAAFGVEAGAHMGAEK